MILEELIGAPWNHLSHDSELVAHDIRDLSPPGKEERALSDDLASNSGS